MAVERIPLDQDTWELDSPRLESPLQVTVPGCVHSNLYDSGLIPDPFWGENEKYLQWIHNTEWTYRRRLRWTPEAASAVRLELDTVDTVAEVRWNGQLLGRTENMFRPHAFDVTDHLREGENVLEIRFPPVMALINSRASWSDWREICDPVGGCSLVRKAQCSFGWDWGPRFPTCGVTGGVRLVRTDGRELPFLKVTQEHRDGRVTVRVEGEDDLPPGTAATAVLSLQGTEVERAALEDGAARLDVAAPRLWWPNGWGEQPLYDLEVLLGADGAVQDRRAFRLGLRTLELEREADEWGESFAFAVNGRRLFAKGANWIPAHAFPDLATDDLYEDLLRSAADASFNMLRVWGGGYYEKEVFYDLCDRMGILVWQDFMFACSLYPGEEEFMKEVRLEAEHQVRRLRHRACLALWCGNNELEQHPDEITKTAKRKKAYDDLFYGILPDVVGRLGAATAYWPASPHNPEGYELGHNNEHAGDSHFWEVWHDRKPIRTYEEKRFRFCSEFGMQSYSSPEVAATFCEPEEWNVFAPAMESHQKNGGGNGVILHYLSQLFRYAPDYPSLAYLSQLNQLWCIKTGVEHFRRSMPRTMGSLYWQLNDCWPVFSWSSIEFGGHWKALHYAARRFYAPLLVSGELLGEETIHQASNTVHSTVRGATVHTVWDGNEPLNAELVRELRHLDGRVLDAKARNVELAPDTSIRHEEYDASRWIHEHGHRRLLLRLYLRGEGRVLAESTIWLTAPRRYELADPDIKKTIEDGSAGPVIRLKSRAFAPFVMLDAPGLRFSDNYFDLWPGEEKTVTLLGVMTASAEELERVLSVRSLRDGYRGGI